MIELWSDEQLKEVLTDQDAAAIHWRRNGHGFEHVAEGSDNYTYIVQKKDGSSPVIRINVHFDDDAITVKREQLFRKTIMVPETIYVPLKDL